MPRRRREREQPKWQRRLPGSRLVRREPPEEDQPLGELPPPGPEYLRPPVQLTRLRRNAELYEREDPVEVFGGDFDPEPEAPWENRFPGTDIPFVDPLSGQRLSVSSFHVTISSNVKGEGMPGENVSRIHSALDYAGSWLFKDGLDRGFEKAYKVIQGSGRGGGRNAGYPPLRSDIIKVEWRTTGREVGQRPKGGRVHIHAILKVWHYTKLQVNVRESQRYLNAMLTQDKDQDVQPPIPAVARVLREEIRGVYLHVSYMARQPEMIEIYGNKDAIGAFQGTLGGGE